MKRILFFIVIVILCLPVKAQVTGQNPALTGTTKSYSFTNGSTITSPNWTITGPGTITSTSTYGTTYVANVSWTGTGSATVSFRTGSYTLSGITVVVSNCPPTAPSVTNGERCGSGTVTLSATPGVMGATVKWYSASSGGTALATGNTFTTPSISSTQTYYARTLVDNCESSSTAVIATVNSIPPTPTVTNAARCGSGTVTLNATPGVGGGTVKWYSASSGGTLLATGNSFTTPTISSTQTYYARTVANNCESSSTAAIATVNAVPATPSNLSVERCDPGTVTLNVSVPGGHTCRWFATPVIQNAIYFGNVYTPTVSSNTTYYFTVLNISTNCESNLAYASAIVNPVPTVAASGNVPLFSGGQTNIAITNPNSVSGTSFSWAVASSQNVSGAQGGTGSTIAQVLTTPVTANDGTVTYTVTAATPKCQSSANVVTSVFAVPEITSSTKTFVKGSSITLSVLGSGYDQYSWKRNGVEKSTGTSCATQDPGGYTLTVTKQGISKTTSPYVLKNQLDAINENYVVTNQVLIAGQTDVNAINNLPVTQVSQTITYVDGLGRTSQNIVTQGSPLKADVVQPIVYDQYGRETRKYLPFVPALQAGPDASNGLYKADIIDAQGNYIGLANDFYNNNVTPNIAQDSRPFGETEFEQSPLNRPIKSFGAGQGWHQSGSEKFTETRYKVNVYGTGSSAESEKVIAWKVSSNSPVRETPATGYIESGGYYSSAQLSVNAIIDEQGNAIREYKNKSGQVVLKKVQVTSAGSSNLNDLTGITPGWALTYYVYDDFGNLRFVLPPELSKIAHSSDTALMNSTRLSNWAFQYTYDARKRMATKQVPGAGPVYMVYDNRDRLVATQDANQRSTANKYWSFTKYDQFNRPILTGIKDTAAVLTQADMQAAVDAHYAKAWTKPYETYVGSAVAGNMHGYSNKSYPVFTGPTTANDKDRYLSVTYYDNYNYKVTLADSNRYAFSTNHLVGQNASYFKRLTGQVTGTKIKVLDGGITGNYTWLTTVNYYDNDHRLIQMVTDNYKGGTDRITNKYDFIGRILKSKATHTTYDVKWKDLVGVGFQGNRIYRSAAGNAWGTGGAASVEQLGANQNGWVEVNVTDNTSQRMFGLSDSNPDANIANLDYAVYMDGSVLRVYKNGNLAPSGNLSGQTVKGELLRWERSGTNLLLKRNGTTVYTFTGVTTAALMADVAFYTNNGSVANVNASFAETTHSVIRSFTYDHAGRVLKVWHRLDNEDSVLLVKNEYNELGQLVDKKLHSTNGATFKQSLDYAYNIRGWLTKMNESDLSAADPDAGRDLFGMQLGYNDDLGISNTPLYNGNISGIKWSRNLALSDTTQNAYVYTYDPMNRIKTSAFKEKIVSSWSTLTNYGYGETGFNYDLNGNILALKRNDRRPSAQGLMDDLTYDYGTANTQSNKLLTVTDAGDKAKGFVDGSATGSTVADYAYDLNGNMVWDRNKGGVETLANGSFDNGSIGWTLTNSARLTFINGEVQIASGAANSTLTQTNPATNKPFLVTIEVERTAGTLIVYLGGQNTSITASGTYMLNVTSSGNSNLVLTAQGTFVGKIKNVSVKGQTIITYNFLNLPELVTRPGDKQLQYIYDASGRKLRQEVSKNSVMEKTTDYAGEYIYENDTLRFINHEEGRIVPSLSGAEDWEYQYHLKDHLGNVRMTFTSKRVVDNPVATMETANATAEHSEFLYYDEAVKINSSIFDHTNSGATQYATRLTGLTNHRYGLAKSISVMPGDTVLATVFAKYLERDTTLWNNGNGLATLMNTVRWGTPAAGVLIDGGTAGTTGGVTPPYAALLAKGQGTQTGAPKAYLNFLVFDRDYHVLDGGFIGVTTAAREYGQDGVHEELSKQLIIKKAGYVYLYLSNDNAALGGNAIEVFFDDFTVEHTKSPVVQQDDYYAFGLAFNSYSRENSTKQNYLYNGKEKQDELDLGWYDYSKRMYQSEIGRWNAVDPSVEHYESISPYAYTFNNPIRFIDIKGSDPGDVVVIFAGGDLSSNRGLGSTGDIASGLREQYFNDRGGAVKNFPSTYWDMKVYGGQYGPVAGATNTMDGGLDEATQEAYDYVLKNYASGGRVVVYGYSYGGVLASHLEKRLKENKIQVDFLVTVDAAAGPQSDQVDRVVSDNTKENLNIYQTTPSSIGSRGGENKRADGSKKGVTNRIKVSYVDDKGKKRTMTHGVIDDQSATEVIQAILEKLNKKDDKKK